MLVQREAKTYFPFQINLKLLYMALIPSIPLVSLLLIEALSDWKFSACYTWASSCPKAFLLSYIVMFGIINVFFGLPYKVYLVISSILLGFFSILGLISHEKLTLKGSPLVPTDFLLAKEAVEISGGFKSVYIYIAIIALGTAALIWFVLKSIPQEKCNWLLKITVFLISILILSIIYIDFGPVQKAFGIEEINWSQKMNYDENGMMLGFILDAQELKVTQPPNYQKDSIKQILDTNKASYTVDPAFHPNIIIVMSEAFWDPTLIKNVSFSQDPIPFFHSLQKSQTSGIMLSPVYGGGTSNTEFEALTGFSTQLLPEGVIAYAQNINRPVEALPTILKRQGYATSAIHTYDNWFYNRNSVYKAFGFDKFISEEFFNNPEYKGDYIRDTELTGKILNEMKETDKPDFIYAVSMQGHGPYSSIEKPGNTVYAVDSNLSPASQAILNNYTNTVSDVDQSLKELIDGLEQIKEPTEVIFYGDHLPMLGDNYDVYKEANFIQDENTYEDYIKLHSVPFVTWNNFSPIKQNLRLSSNFMGTFALELAKKSGGPMTDFLSNLMQNGSDVVLHQDYLGKEKITSDEMTQYQQLQYDLLFGKEYTYQIDLSHTPPMNTDYIQGDGPIKVSNVVFSDGLLTIEGENFVVNGKVYIDNKPAKSTYTSSSRLTAALPEDYTGKISSIKIQIKVPDSMNKVISESNVYVMGIN